MFNFINNIGPTELIILVLILIVFFGGRIIMRLAKTSGEIVREIKKIKKGFMHTIEDGDKPNKK